jgi:hypothetical protein
MRNLTILLLVASAPASADAPKSTPKLNPDEMVCRTLQETGSRLSAHRLCMTRAEWQEMKRGHRDSLDRAQTQQVNPQGE